MFSALTVLAYLWRYLFGETGRGYFKYVLQNNKLLWCFLLSTMLGVGVGGGSWLIPYFRCWLHRVHLTDLNLALQGRDETSLWSREHWLRDSENEVVSPSLVASKCMVISVHQHAGQNRNIKISNKSCEWVERFKYLGISLGNQNSIHEEIKSRLKAGNACWHSMQNISSCTFLSKNTKINIYRIVILLVFWTGFKLGLQHWGRSIGWECSRVGCWGRYLGIGRDCIMRCFMICILTPHFMLMLWQTRANCLGTNTSRDSSPKTSTLTTLPPHCLQLWTIGKL